MFDLLISTQNLILFRKLLLAFSFFVATFYFYRKGKSQGFNGEKLLDLFVYSSVVSVLVYNLLSFVVTVQLAISFLIFHLFFSYIAKNGNWSYAKVSDIAAEAVCFSLIFAPMPTYLFNVQFLLVWIFIRWLLKFQPKGGLIFYAFSFYLSLVTALWFLSIDKKTLIGNPIILFVFIIFLFIRIIKGGYGVECKRLFSQVFVAKINGFLSKIKTLSKRSQVKQEEKSITENMFNGEEGQGLTHEPGNLSK